MDNVFLCDFKALSTGHKGHKGSGLKHTMYINLQLTHQGPLQLIWINFNNSRDK